jgi:hypothetical protein
VAIVSLGDWRTSLNPVAAHRSIVGAGLFALAVLSSACGGTHRSGEGQATYVGPPSLASAQLAAQQPCKTARWATVRVAAVETKGSTTFFTVKC